VVAVTLSVITALLIGDSLFGQYNLSFAAIILLFAMVLATDPVSVVSIFSKFELPHRLKILCEGESLFRSEEHTSELQSHHDIVCRLLLEKKKRNFF